MSEYVFITGAAGGLGRAFAAECAARGWNLFLTDLLDGPLESTAAGLERMYGVEVRRRACDLTDADQRAALWRHVAEAGLRFHLLINVAGLDVEGPFEERRAEELRRIIRLNIEATVETTLSILPRKADRLRVITVSSFAAFFPMPIKAVYAASKRFLLDWSLALHEELRGQGVSVTVLCPSGMPTNADNIRAIEAQGVAARLVVMNVGDVAAGTIDAALAGRTVYVPGAANRALRWLLAPLSPSLIARAIERRWRRTTVAARHFAPSS